jgi:dTDP-4-dehydrorhamnose 3,5-epimerase-like enzyme|tara:strand:- start:1469 stop:1873 length:405 start_codon:yes stop_codon:yes gene_type:complete
MKKIRKFKLKSYSRSSGKLIPINFDKKFPIKVKRIFFINGKKNKIRGEHAHKKCSQFFIPIQGKMALIIETPNSKRSIILSGFSITAILVPPRYWCSIKFLEKNSTLMVACDKYYNAYDYLESFEEYKEYLRKK